MSHQEYCFLEYMPTVFISPKSPVKVKFAGLGTFFRFFFKFVSGKLIRNLIKISVFQIMRILPLLELKLSLTPSLEKATNIPASTFSKFDPAVFVAVKY